MALPSRADFSKREDPFQLVVECPELYGSALEYAAAVQHIGLIAQDLPTRTAAQIRLGLLYAGRTRLRDDFRSVITEIRSIEGKFAGDLTISAMCRLVHGGILQACEGEYGAALEILRVVRVDLKDTDRHFLYGLTSRALGMAETSAGKNDEAEEDFQDALATFRRYNNALMHAFTVNDYAILKKKLGQFDDAERLLRQALREFDRMRLTWGQVISCVNLGIVNLKRGNWRGSEVYFDRAAHYRDMALGKPDGASQDSRLSVVCDTNQEHLLIRQRRFEDAEPRLVELVNRHRDSSGASRVRILTREYLGELYMESGDPTKAGIWFAEARSMSASALAQSDVMTEILRRQADLECRRGNVEKAVEISKECIWLCKKISDKHELGAVLRVLGEARAMRGEVRKAEAAFETGIHTLKSIHECYELMRSCIAYGAFLVERGERDAEVYLMEARQLCKKLEIDFYAAKINVLLAGHATNAGTYEEARSYLYEAEGLFDKLQDCDQKQLKPLLKAATEALDKAILQSSISAARELKTICKVYEEARFPIEEMKPDLAYQVTQSVGAESLFLVRRWKRGYEVPLVYNIPSKEAKELVRRLDRDGTSPLLGIKGDPRVFSLTGGTTLVGVPGQASEGYVLCTVFKEHRAFSPRQLEFLLASAEAMERLAEDRELSRATTGDDFMENEGGAPSHPRGSFKDILTIDPEMIKLIHLAERASRSEAPILLEGETGVGKELFARAIHGNSPRRDKSFVAINAGGMPVNFLESQLFGHVKGAYTDAANDRIGLVEEARGGTIFFDEVGEMGEELQVKLLRLLENGEFRRLGENRVYHADVRVISATNRDVTKEVERRKFRRDLFYRLSTVKLTIPPLRFRQRDVQLLIRHFLKECAARNRMFDRHFQIDVKAMEALELYNWPGNVRELNNEMMRIVSLIGDVDMIRFGMLSDGIKEYVKLKNRSEGLLEESVERYERRLILEALNRNDWNRLRTAEYVGIPRTTLLAKMKRLNIATR